MIDYKLAKQLKDAGFPQDKMHGGQVFKKGNPNKNLYRPTLEELVEVCSNDIHYLSHWCNGLHTDDWYVVYNQDTPNMPLCERGHTPSEALANLYIQLNN